MYCPLPLSEGDDYEGSEEEHHLLGDMILSLERAHEQAIELRP